LTTAQRAAGVQLHITSLPGGRLGDEALAFADWLADAGASWWQLLPLGPPDEHRSPYKAASAFAAWPELLGDPDAPVSGAEVDAFREAEPWAEGWEAFGGDLADQVRFGREWAALREHCASRGVRLIGDIPIYVAPEGADHRANPELFRDDAVSGVPPDAFTADGQLWGNPLYDWPAMRRRGYRWWVQRFARTFDLFDLARIDHFRAFAAYWAVPRDAETAASGRWARGPGRAPFEAARRALGELPLIAEDLGVITEPVERLRDGLGLPGMAVLQFGFDPEEVTPHDPPRHKEHQVLYTGTHDNETLAGWLEGLPDERRALVDEAVGGLTGEGHWQLVELAASCRPSLLVLQAQDVLGLGNEARMNTPGVEGGQWAWALEPGQLGAAEARRLRRVLEAAGRA
jgi:4-alpha-glucanotransferase